MNEKGSVTVSEQGVGVGSGVGIEPPKSLESAPIERRVSPINDTRKHPDPNLAQSIATMSFAGFTMDRVCNALRLSESTVRKYYDYEFKNGQSNLVADIAGSLADRARSGSDTAAIFLLKTRGGGKFTERNALELTGKDGGPIEIAQRTEILQTVNGLLRKGITIEGEVEPLD